MAATADQYRQRLAQEQARYGRGPNTFNESARDAAVRATNQALGYGNSTAMQKFAPAAPAKKAAPASGGGGKAKVGGPKTSSTGSPYNLPANMTSPSAAPGFYTGADPGLTQSPTSVAQPSLGPTTQPQPSLGPTTQPGFYPTPPPVNPVPANPAMSQASVLQTLNPALLPNRMTTPTSAHSRWGSLFPTPPPYTGAGNSGFPNLFGVGGNPNQFLT